MSWTTRRTKKRDHFACMKFTKNLLGTNSKRTPLLTHPDRKIALLLLTSSLLFDACSLSFASSTDYPALVLFGV